MDEFINGLTTRELRKILFHRGLSLSYKVKTQLVDRLKASLTTEDTVDSLQLILEEGNQSNEEEEFEDTQGDMTTNFTFKDVKDALENFSGESERSLEKWKINYEAVATTCKWNDIQKYLYARKLLVGAARKAIEADDTVNSYTTLIDKLKEEFREEITIIEIHEKLIKRKKLDSETYLEYFYDVQRIAKAKMDVKSMIQYIVNGIQDDPSNKAILYDAESLEELKNKLKTYEIIKSQRKLTYGKNKNTKNTMESNVSSSSVRCFNCGSKSHQRVDCPDKSKGARCFNCNNFGHKAKECKEKKATSAGSTNNNPSQVSRITTTLEPGEGQIVVRHNEDNIVAMVDSGSPVTLMKQSVYNNLKKRPVLKRTTRSFTGFGNVVSKTLGATNCKFIIDGEEYECECQVVKDSHIVDDMLIGKDILNQADVNMRRGKVTMKKIVNEDEKEDGFIGRIQEFTTLNTSLPEIKLSHIEDEKARATVKEMIKNYKPKVPEKSCIEMNICLTDDVPVYEKPRRLAPMEKEIVNNMIQDWLKRGICRPSNSAYASPVVLRPKKTKGLWRLCIDFRRLNKKVIRDRFPLPIMDEVLDILQGARVYSNLDLTDGFFHVDVNHECVKFLSFIIPDGQYECLKAPFGFANSPAVFQRFVNTIFKDLVYKKLVAVYLDDLAVPGTCIKNGVDNLKVVLEKAAENGLNINWRKCSFLSSRIAFLGFIIEKGTIKPSTEKTEAVRKFPPPNNVQQVQSFLGLTGFFRRFIENYATIAKPLTDLTRKDVKFEFGDDQQDAFVTLKAELCNDPVLKMFNPEAETTEVHTDASKFGLGAVLMQKDSEDGKIHPVYYLSFKTTPAQQKYDSYDLETFAIYKTLKKWRVYLLGLKFQVFTDCQAFQRSMQKKDLVDRIAKWAIFISQFECTLKHRAGAKMKHVDALSRIPRIMLIEDGLVTKVKQMQREDDNCKAILNILESKGYEDYVNRNGILYKWVEGASLLVVPRKIQKELIRSIHERGHLSTTKVEILVKRDYFITGLRSKISEVIANCIACILANRKEGKKEGLLMPIDKGDSPLHTYHVDHMGPLESTAKSYKHLLIIIDAFTKFVWIYPVKDKGAEEVIKKLNLQREVFGDPFRIIADKGGAFKSNELETYCHDNNIHLHLITTGVPRSNGQVERINRIIIPMLAKMSNENPLQWYRHVPRLQMFLNSTSTRSTGHTPFEMLVGVKMKTTEDQQLAQQLNEALENDFMEERKEQRRLAKENIMKLQQENRKSYNRNRKQAIKYKLGDLVAIQRTQGGGGLKLKGKFLGPYEVTQVKRGDRYSVIKVGTHEGPNITSTAADHMKPWATMEDSDTSSEADD